MRGVVCVSVMNMRALGKKDSLLIVTWVSNTTKKGFTNGGKKEKKRWDRNSCWLLTEHKVCLKMRKSTSGAAAQDCHKSRRDDTKIKTPPFSSLKQIDILIRSLFSKEKEKSTTCSAMWWRSRYTGREAVIVCVCVCFNRCEGEWRQQRNRRKHEAPNWLEGKKEAGRGDTRGKWVQ